MLTVDGEPMPLRGLAGIGLAIGGRRNETAALLE
jgi:hypothetical protein